MQGDRDVQMDTGRKGESCVCVGCLVCPIRGDPREVSRSPTDKTRGYREEERKEMQEGRRGYGAQRHGVRKQGEMGKGIDRFREDAKRGRERR